MDWITSLRLGKIIASNDEGIVLYFDKNVTRNLVFEDGDTRIDKTNFLTLPVSDTQMGERAIKAFNQLAKLCKEKTK